MKDDPVFVVTDPDTGSVVGMIVVVHDKIFLETARAPLIELGPRVLKVLCEEKGKV